MPDRFKVTVVGNAMVGKTSLLFAFTQENYQPLYEPTVFESQDHVFSYGGTEYKLHLIDTAGQEEYRNLRTMLYKKTNVFLLCFALDDKLSLEDASNTWYPDLLNHSPDTPIILVGTKSDLREEGVPCISEKEAVKVRKHIGAVNYVESSAKKQTQVKRVFQEAVLTAIEHSRPKRKCIFL